LACGLHCFKQQRNNKGSSNYQLEVQDYGNRKTSEEWQEVRREAIDASKAADGSSAHDS
jgi:hypothetical protein